MCVSECVHTDTHMCETIIIKEKQSTNISMGGSIRGIWKKILEEMERLGKQREGQSRIILFQLGI